MYIERESHNGSAPAFQAGYAGSSPVSRSNSYIRGEETVTGVEEHAGSQSSRFRGLPDAAPPEAATQSPVSRSIINLRAPACPACRQAGGRQEAS